LHKVTYAPIRPSPQDEANGAAGATAQRRRGLEKAVFANALHTSTAEIEAVKATLNPQTDGATILALNAINQATSRGGTARAGWKSLGQTPTGAVVAAGRAIARYRRARRAELRAMAHQLASDYAAYVRSTLGGPVITAAPQRETPAAVAPAAATAVAALAAPAAERAAVDGPASNGALVVASPPDAGIDPRLSAASLKTGFGAAMDWARVRDPARADALAGLARRVAGVAVDFADLSKVDWDAFAGTVVGTSEDAPDWTDDLTDGFEERMKVEPIGRLHLERIDMTPAGVVRGELVHSVGLAPAETVTLIHREWSSREVSFEKVVSEEFEQSTEEGVTENTELASATETQSRHSSALSMEATASGSWGFASASATLGYNSTSGDETTKRDSRNHTIEVTRKASSRTRKEHKVTLTVKQQAGVEDESVRTLTNPSQTQPMRIDFHQMVRDWRVDLYRYGLRLTYDIVVPAPGIDLLANVDELRRVDHQLSQPFTFTLAPAEITRANWQALAARYGADVEPPEPEVLHLQRQLAYPYRTEDEAKNPRYDTLEFEVPAGYYVSGGDFTAFFSLYSGGHYDVVEDAAAPIGHNGPEMRSYETALGHLAGRQGQVAVVMFSEGVVAGHAKATLEVAQSQDGWQTWQNAAWSALRKGAAERWQLQRQDLQQRRDQLEEALGRWDPLTLRRMEREEVMKTTLKWIFGPAFDLMPSEVSRLYGGEDGGLATLEPSRLTVAQWAQAMGLGEFVKFLHQAIEWENVLYFVYPYFWDHPRNHPLKRFLHHPDALHQAFLRGGAARVVLTVRPGFEESFTKLFETGSLDGELGNHPYLTIAQEIRNYAAAHYPGIPGSTPGNEPPPEAVAAAERGELIARWHDYTPVSALDISVNTPLSELK
jgi:hypothetical protein